MTNFNWGGLPGGHVPWRAAIPALPAYLHSSTENILATARHVCDNILQENRLVRVQNLSNFCHILPDCLVNQTDFAWDDLWDDPVED